MRGPYLTIADEEKSLLGKYFWSIFIALGGLCALLLVFLVPNYLEVSPRSSVSKAKADMRSLATAIETYIVDQCKYPDNTENFTLSTVLTTPIAYASIDIFRDPHKTPEFGCIDNSTKYWFKRLFPEGSVIPFALILIPAILIGIITPFIYKSHSGSNRLKEWGRLSLPFAVWGVIIYAAVFCLHAYSDGAAAPRLCAPGESPPKWPDDQAWIHYRNVLNVRDSPELTDAVRSHAWVLYSVGPDGDIDLNLSDLEDKCYCLPSFYDPTNGARSSGDVIRTGMGQLN